MGPGRLEARRADAAVLSSTRFLLDVVRRQTGVAYAHDDWSPVADLSLGFIARALGTTLEQADLPAGIQELGFPGYAGAPLLQISRSAPRQMQRLALRHGLAHVVAGELEGEQGREIRMMSSLHDWMAMEERRADLFALADLIPNRVLGGLTLGELEREIRQFAPLWPATRIADRGLLRMMLAAG